MKKEIVFNILFTVSILFVYAIFPTKNNFQNIAVSVCFFLLVPILFNLIVTKKSFREMGFSLSWWKEGFLWAFISLVVGLLLFYVAFYYTGFAQHYVLEKEIQNNFYKFLSYEFSLVLPFIILYEFFFRGFFMLSLKKQIGYSAILVQAVFFVLFLVFTGSFDWYFAPYLLFSLFSGIVAYKSESIIYSAIANIVFMVIVDASVIATR